MEVENSRFFTKTTLCLKLAEATSRIEIKNPPLVLRYFKAAESGYSDGFCRYLLVVSRFHHVYWCLSSELEISLITLSFAPLRACCSLNCVLICNNRENLDQFSPARAGFYCRNLTLTDCLFPEMALISPICHRSAWVTACSRSTEFDSKTDVFTVWQSYLFLHRVLLQPDFSSLFSHTLRLSPSWFRFWERNGRDLIQCRSSHRFKSMSRHLS